MTRLISNSTRSRRAASADGGTGASPAAGLPEGVSSGVLAALVTWLPGRAGPALRSGRPPTGRHARRRPVSYRFLSERCGPRGYAATKRDTHRAEPKSTTADHLLLAWLLRRAAPPVAARRPC